MTVLYVASDREGAGKTALCAAVARGLEQRGRRVAVFKPVVGAETGSESDPDSSIYHRLLGQQPAGWPLDLPDGGLTPGLMEDIESAFNRVADGTDVVLVEGSCALSPEDSNRLADALDARVLAVARYRHDMSASQLARWGAPFGDRLLGFVINGLTRYLGTEVGTKLLPAMESEGLVSFGVIPEDRRLLGVTVGQLAEHLDGRFVVCEEKADTIVEHLMVGGRGMDPADLYFGLRKKKAVIARGDRPDIQMSAMGTPTSCMVLTRGIEPIEYVRYEAEQEGISVLVVQTDTLGTMDALNTLIERARFDHPLKLCRFVELVERHVDLGALFGGMGL